MPTIRFCVDEKTAEKTLKEYFLEQQYSTNQIKRFKYAGKIAVNGKAVTVRHRLEQGDVVELCTDARLKTPAFSQTPAKILFADSFLYIAEKPFGVAIHPDRAHRNDTLGNRLATTFSDGFELRIVTRLDKTTSGLVLGALDEITAQKLNQMQLHHQIEKRYLAQVEGIVEQDRGTICLPLSRSDSQNKTLVDSGGKNAETFFEVIERKNNRTTLLVTPKTGRTHQIRTHLAATGHPIVGDELYGAQKAQRVMLHCGGLKFAHPITKQTVDVFCAADFESAADNN